MDSNCSHTIKKITLLLIIQIHVIPQSIAMADMDQPQLEAFLTAQTKKQGGVNTEQAAALSRFWKGQWGRVRESLLGQSRWEAGLRGLTWRVDLPTSASRGEAASSPVALVELELGRTGEVRGREGGVFHPPCGIHVTGVIMPLISVSSPLTCHSWDQTRVL